MPVILIFGAVALWLSIPFLTGQTFGQRCSKAFDADSAEYERCVQRLIDGGGVHFEIKKQMTPVSGSAITVKDGSAAS